jgi:hypothetical protein
LPAQIVPELAAKGGYELIVVGAKGRSDIPFLPTGSVALAVLEQHLPANVLLVREREMQEEAQMPAPLPQFTVLFATDGSSRIATTAQSFYRLFSVHLVRAFCLDLV